MAKARASSASSSDTPARIISRTYVRVSDVRGRDKARSSAENTPGSDFISPELQIDAGARFAQAFGWEFDADASTRLADLGQSGFSKTWRKRPGITGHLADAERGLFHRLTVYKLSRIARNAREGLEIFDAFERVGVTIHVIQEGIDTSSAAGRMLRTIMLAVAEMQAEDARQYAIDTHVRRAGLRKLPSSIPAWIRRSPETGEYYIDEVAALPYRRILELRCAGMSQRTIAHTLNTEVLRSPTGLKWSASAIRDLFKGRKIQRFAGIATYDIIGFDAIEIPNAYPALAGAAQMSVLRGIRDTLSAEAAPGKRGASTITRWILSSRIWCAICGGRMQASTSGVSDVRTASRRYTCPSFHDVPEEQDHQERQLAGKSFTLVAPSLEDAAMRVARFALLPMSNQGKATGKVSKLAKSKPAPAEMAATARAREILDKMQDLLMMRMERQIQIDHYRTQYAALEAELREAQSVKSGSELEITDQLQTEAVAAIASGNLRWFVLNMIARVDAPVYVPGIEYTRSSNASTGLRQGNGSVRRCARVTLRFPLAQGTVFIAPIYRASYRGARAVYSASHTLLWETESVLAGNLALPETQESSPVACGMSA